MICPLHGPVWRENIGWFVDKYLKWSSYTPEKPSVLIAYGSIYGHTENMANVLASRLADLGVRDIAVYDVSSTHPSYILSEAFRRSHLVFASVTYNGGIFSNMEHLLLELKAHNLQNLSLIHILHNRKEANYQDFRKELISDLQECVELARSAGIPDDRIILDPGVGFGKTYEMNLQAIAHLEEVRAMGFPVLLGTSRKSVIGRTLDLPADQRLEGTLVTTVLGVQQGCAFIRVHDVKENKRAVQMTKAIMER